MTVSDNDTSEQQEFLIDGIGPFFLNKGSKSVNVTLLMNPQKNLWLKKDARREQQICRLLSIASLPSLVQGAYVDNRFRYLTHRATDTTKGFLDTLEVKGRQANPTYPHEQVCLIGTDLLGRNVAIPYLEIARNLFFRHSFFSNRAILGDFDVAVESSSEHRSEFLNGKVLDFDGVITVKSGFGLTQSVLSANPSIANDLIRLCFSKAMLDSFKSIRRCIMASRADQDKQFLFELPRLTDVRFAGKGWYADWRNLFVIQELTVFSYKLPNADKIPSNVYIDIGSDRVRSESGSATKPHPVKAEIPVINTERLPHPGMGHATSSGHAPNTEQPLEGVSFFVGSNTKKETTSNGYPGNEKELIEAGMSGNELHPLAKAGNLACFPIDESFGPQLQELKRAANLLRTRHPDWKIVENAMPVPKWRLARKPLELKHDSSHRYVGFLSIHGPRDLSVAEVESDDLHRQLSTAIFEGFFSHKEMRAIAEHLIVNSVKWNFAGLSSPTCQFVCSYSVRHIASSSHAGRIAVAIEQVMGIL